MQRRRMVPAHSPNGECGRKPRQTGQWGPSFRGHPRSQSQALVAQVGPPGGGLSGPAQFSPTMGAAEVRCSDSKFQVLEESQDRC